jgi:hypothetical protein
MPHRGQPIDFKYLSDIARSIDSIENSISKKSKISIGESQQEINTVDVKIETAKVNATNPSAAVNLNGIEVTYTFTSGFAYAPTVTVSPSYTGTAAVKPGDIDVVITSITASQVKMKVSFNVKVSLTASLNIIAIGIPAGM